MFESAKRSPLTSIGPRVIKHLEWTPSRLVHWAQSIGPSTARLFKRILEDKPHPEMGYRGSLGILRLARDGEKFSLRARSLRKYETGENVYHPKGGLPRPNPVCLPLN